jgi:hypothetical protein
LPDGRNCIPPRTTYHDTVKLKPKLYLHMYVPLEQLEVPRAAMHNVATCVNDRFTLVAKLTPTSHPTPSLDRYFGPCVYFVNPNHSRSRIFLSFMSLAVRPYDPSRIFVVDMLQN